MRQADDYSAWLDRRQHRFLSPKLFKKNNLAYKEEPIDWLSHSSFCKQGDDRLLHLEGELPSTAGERNLRYDGLSNTSRHRRMHGDGLCGGELISLFCNSLARNS